MTEGWQHWEWDLVYWGVFIAGQMLFLLKRADLARRSPLNGMRSIGQFFGQNWVVIITRLAFESLLLYTYRHPDVPADMGLHFSLPIKNQSLLVAFFGGFFSDAALDWIVMQDRVMGIPVPQWLKEQIPQLPAVQRFVSYLAANGGGKP